MEMIKRVLKAKNKKTIFKRFINKDSKNNNLTNDKKVIEMLKTKIKHSKFKDENLYLKDMDLTIEAHVSQINKTFIQVIFVLKNKVFDEDLFECIGANGENLNSAMENAIDNFLLTTLYVVTNALTNQKGEKFKVKYYDKVNEFTLYKNPIISQGNEKGVKTIDYWNLIRKEIEKRLGNKRIYYIKVYASKSGNLTNCECKINGKVNISISQIVNKYIDKWNIGEAIYYEKQSFILIQENKTYRPYSFSKMHINHIIMKVLDLYKKCDSEEKYNNLYTEIFNFCKDSSLTTELFFFIPEIFCELMFSKVKYSEEIILLRGNEKIQLFKEQIMSYNFIYDMIEKTIKSGYFKNEEITNIVFKSSLFNSINKALNSGNNIENLYMVPLAFNVDKNYKVF